MQAPEVEDIVAANFACKYLDGIRVLDRVQQRDLIKAITEYYHNNTFIPLKPPSPKNIKVGGLPHLQGPHSPGT